MLLPESAEHDSQDKNCELKAYCLFCCAGYEEKVARTINEQNNDLFAYAVMQEKHRSRNGVRSIIRQAMLPGYVFIYSESEKSIPTKKILLDSKAIRFLKNTDEEIQLQGNDLEYAKWVLHYNGLFRCSKAIRLGSRVRIIEGPLKDYEGQIKEISKKNRNGRIEISFMGRLVSIWLPFEWVEDDEAATDSIPRIQGL